MINSTSKVVVSEKKMKKKRSGPRAETLMMICHFARMYEFKPEQKQKTRKSLVN